jgi:hypothetical protein
METIRSGVFPTRVGVFLSFAGYRFRCPSLPHARGGVSSLDDAGVVLDQSSPRAWGCFRTDDYSVGIKSVFPTRVGVFPRVSRYDGVQ